MKLLIAVNISARENIVITSAAKLCSFVNKPTQTLYQETILYANVCAQHNMPLTYIFRRSIVDSTDYDPGRHTCANPLPASTIFTLFQYRKFRA